MNLHPFLAQEERPAGPSLGDVPFQAHVELLHLFLVHRDDIVERIQGVLNAQRKPIEYLQDGAAVSRHLVECFFRHPLVTHGQQRLARQLEDVHWAGGFRPRDAAGHHNGVVDAAEMAMRAFHLWRQTRWPGRSGRVRYAHTLFNVYVIRRLELLSMRLWDAGTDGVGERLSQVQGLLDQLWKTSGADQPVLVRDARWLVQTAQSPVTDDLGAYFEVAERIAETLSQEDRIEIHKAGVRMAGGHLRSQIRYYAMKNAVSLDEKSLVLSTRHSNALDFAILIQDLVPLLEAYEHAWRDGDGRTRLELAGAICQGISPDPELFVNRVELLGAYSMIEHLFIATDRDGQVGYTPMGLRHVRLLQDYQARIGRVAKALHEDCSSFRPVAGAYSPYGLIYGFSSDLLGHMALKATQPDAVTRFGLEDAFAGGDGPDKLAWVNGWRTLPHLDEAVIRLFDYPQQFAEDVFSRIEQSLHRRVSDDETSAGVRTGRVFILPAGARAADDSPASSIPDLPARYVGSSDPQMVAEHEAEFHDEPRLLADRREGKCVLSYRTPGGWAAITKDVLTDVLGAGRDVKVVGLPPAAAAVLTLMCPGLVVPPENGPPRSDS